MSEHKLWYIAALLQNKHLERPHLEAPKVALKPVWKSGILSGYGVSEPLDSVTELELRQAQQVSWPSGYGTGPRGQGLQARVLPGSCLAAGTQAASHQSLHEVRGSPR